jgi:uncharacterized lipoprotein YmbA
MTVHLPSRRQLMIGAGLMPLVAACAETAPPRFFTLAARPPATGSTSPPRRAATTVMVKSVEIAKYLDRPQIVRYADPYELRLFEFERWGEGMRDMVTRVMVENLSLRLPGGQVFAGSGPLTMHADTTVETEISRFDADPDGTVVLAAQWAVQRDGKRTRLQAKHIRVPTSPSDIAQLVAAMSDALGQLGDQIAFELAA